MQNSFNFLGNGSIDYEEFCEIMRDLVTVAMEMGERIRSTFSTMDLDGDGKISHEELKKVNADKVYVCLYVRIFVCVIRNNVEHLCNSNLLLYYVYLNMYK